MDDSDMSKTIKYYDDPSNTYADQTLHADMSAIYERFEKYLAPGQQCWMPAVEAVGTVSTL